MNKLDKKLLKLCLDELERQLDSNELDFQVLEEVNLTKRELDKVQENKPEYLREDKLYYWKDVINYLRGV